MVLLFDKTEITRKPVRREQEATEMSRTTMGTDALVVQPANASRICLNPNVKGAG
jgi:hypothetical protein